MVIACETKYLHSPAASDRSRWPYDTPIIVTELKRRQFTIANAASLESAEIFDATGQRWMHRALGAEAHLRDATKASEHILSRLFAAERKLRLQTAPPAGEEGR